MWKGAYHGVYRTTYWYAHGPIPWTCAPSWTVCKGPRMICGSTSRLLLRYLIDHCFRHCNCGLDTERGLEHTMDVDTLILQLFFPSAQNALQHHKCSGSCTSVTRGYALCISSHRRMFLYCRAHNFSGKQDAKLVPSTISRADTGKEDSTT